MATSGGTPLFGWRQQTMTEACGAAQECPHCRHSRKSGPSVVVHLSVCLQFGPPLPPQCQRASTFTTCRTVGKKYPHFARETPTSIVSIYFMAAHCEPMSDGENRGCNKFGPIQRLSTVLHESLLISLNLAWQGRTGLGWAGPGRPGRNASGVA